MPAEIILFWGVAAAFLLADNLVLLPAGGDWLRLKASGRLDYDPSLRLEARGRELVVLNPLDLFQRAVVTDRSLGPVDRRAFRVERQRVRRARATMNLLSGLGSAYLACAVALAGLSFVRPFSEVLLTLLAVHLGFWVVMGGLLLWRRQRLGLALDASLVLLAEALFVPAYTVNLGKRLWARQVSGLPAMTLGIRQARRTRSEAARELLVHRLRQRLELLEASLPDEPPAAARPAALAELVKEAKACLTA